MKKRSKLFMAWLAGISLVVSFPASALAASVLDLTPPTGSEFSKLGNYTIPQIVSALVGLVLVVAGLVAFAYLIFGGVMWISSSGDKGKIETARNTITAALIGLLIVFSTWAIIQLIQVFFGVNILKMAIPSIGIGEKTPAPGP